MKSNFLKSLVLLLALMTPLAYAATPVGVARLKGTYSFQVTGVNVQNGSISTNGGKSNNQTIVTSVTPKITVGTISFNGAGKATFLSITNYNQGSGGGPVKGTVATYKVSGVVGTLTIPGTKGGTVSLSLGSYNAQGIATVVQFFIFDTQPMTGIAILQ